MKRGVGDSPERQLFPTAGATARVSGGVRVKVCCIASVAEAHLAAELGASAIGLVSAMPSGPGVIDEVRIAEIAAAAPPGLTTFLLTSLQDVDAIVAQHRRCPTSAIQLCDASPSGFHARLRTALSGVRLIQVIHITGAESVDEARAASEADALLLDSGRRDLAVKELGGTGRTHDWAVSRRIREAVALPVFLAGGLHADNVREAVTAVRPWAVDLCTGVRTDGRLDESKLHAFMRAVRQEVVA